MIQKLVSSSKFNPSKREWCSPIQIDNGKIDLKPHIIKESEKNFMEAIKESKQRTGHLLARWESSCLALLRSETSAVLQLSYYLTSLLKTRNCRVALYHFYKILIVEQLVSSRHFTFLFPVHSSPKYYSSKLTWWIIVTVNWVRKTPSNS